LNRLVIWLSTNRLWTAVLVTAYTLAIILTHDLFEAAAFWARDRLAGTNSIPEVRWNLIVSWVCIPLLVILCAWVIGQIRKSDRRLLLSVYWLCTVLLAVAAYKRLFVMNIEAIHFIQYAVLAVLLFSLTHRFGETVFWVALVGAADEAFQYLVLHGDRVVYYDCNDLLLNAIGAGFGVLVVAGLPAGREVHQQAGAYSTRKMLLSPAFAAAVVLVVAITLAWATGHLRLFPHDEATEWTLVLRRCGPVSRFWLHTSWGKTYHEVQPAEGALGALVLIAFYTVLDFRMRAGLGGNTSPSPSVRS
jgi:hypothetical protein